MTDLGSRQAAGQRAVVPSPSCMRAKPPRDPAQQLAAAPAKADAQAGPIGLAATGSGRGTARAALAAVLAGVRLSERDKQFLGRLVHWDKRNAASVASLLWRARQAGRDETALTPRQLEVMRAALADAALYRASGTAAAGCWDCEIVPGGRCAEHARDNDRARAYAELAGALAVSAPVPGGDPELVTALLISVAS